MKIRKILALGLAVVFAVGTLAGCGGRNSRDSV